MTRVISLLASVLVFGCVSSHYSKTVTVTRDGEGRILNIVEVEEVVTPGQTGHGIVFEYLPGVQRSNKTAKKPY